MKNPIITIENATVRFRERTLFQNLNFEMKAGEHWAIIGENGTGKSAFLKAIAGKYWVSAGKIEHHFYREFLRSHPVNDPFFTFHNLISLVDIKHDFRNLSNTTEFYYQQRYNSSDSSNAPTVEAYLQSKFVWRNTNSWTIDKVIEKLNLGSLRHKELIKLSNGESKRLRLAAALLKNPVLLLIDNTFAGLDVATRKEFSDLFQEIARSGISIVMVTKPNEIPDVITDIALLENCKIIKTVKSGEFELKSFIKEDNQKIDRAKLSVLLENRSNHRFGSIVKMNKVSVSYGENKILDQLSWEIKQGERWALSGPNGSGKTTLLSLINGDNPQAYANDITLFDRKRGSGESIWEIKQHIGFMSPELYQYFPTNYTCLQAVLSGFYDTIGLFQKHDQAKTRQALDWLELMELQPYAGQTLAGLSASNQRLCLLARALVKNPELLILDEPCQGLDDHHQIHFRDLIDEICKMSPMTLIYVTHYREELPSCIDRELCLGE